MTDPRRVLSVPPPAIEPVPRWDGHVEGRDDPNAHAELVQLTAWGWRPIEWLWEPLIPRRKVTLLVGEQEKGKSYFAIDLAARVTRGEAIPPGGRLDDGPGSALFLVGDDESDDTLYPRLESAFADLDRTFLLTIDGPRNIGQARPQISLTHDVDCLKHAARQIRDCRLIVIDPITAFLDGLSTNNHTAVRRLLSRLTVVAKLNNAAVLLISHNRKSGADNVLHKAVGSLAFTIAARVVLTLVDDPAVDGRRLLLPAKMNLRPASECPGRAFQIEDSQIVWDLEPVHLRPDELTRLVSRGLATSERKLQVAEELRALLASGRVPAKEVHEWADRRRIPRMLLQEAKALAKARSVRDSRLRMWYWELKSREQPTHDVGFAL